MFHNVSVRGCFCFGLGRINLHSIFLTFDPNPVQVLGASVFVEGDIGVGMRLRRMRGYEHAKPCDRCHCLTSWDLIELVVEVTHGQMLRQS
jgi:hypothetical protein